MTKLVPIVISGALIGTAAFMFSPIGGAGLLGSMGSIGDCFDNSVAESRAPAPTSDGVPPRYGPDVGPRRLDVRVQRRDLR